MDFNIDVRRKQLNSLDQFIKSSRENFDVILKSLNWTENVVRKDESMVTCTINPEHKIPNHSLNKHIEKCALREEQYINGSHLLSEPLHDKQASICLSVEDKVKLFSDAVKKNKEFKTVWKCDQPVAKSADRIYSTHTPDERLVLYEHCIASTTGPKNPPDFNIYKLYKNPTGSPLTAEEERSRERDLKRRSFKYKKTFTNRDRDPVEVMREVIDGQMELYREWLIARDQNAHVDDERERGDGTATSNNRKGPRTPEHEAPEDAAGYSCNGRYSEAEEFTRRDSRHSSRSQTIKRERSRSPRRRRSREYQKPQRRRHQSHSRSRSPRDGGNSSQYSCAANKRRNGYNSHDRSRDKRKSYSYSNDKRRERTRSKSPRSGRSRR